MDNSIIQTAIKEARSLHRVGQSEDAIRKLSLLADAGAIDAMVELAHIARDQNRESDSHQWIDKAEQGLKPGDLDGHISLNGAYSLGLGRGDRDVQEARALHHLEQVALAGNAVAQEGLALNFLHGLNGCEKDVGRFEYWIELAVAVGSPRAAYILAEYLHKNGREVGPAIVEALQAARSKNRAAEKLLYVITKRQK